MGKEYLDFAKIYQDSPLTGLRVNTLKLTRADFSHISPFLLEPIPWAKAGFILPTRGDGASSDARPGKHPFHLAGLYYLQDPSAMAAAEVLNPQPGERILDLAAAPGGKSTHLAALMQNQGLLVANEIHPKRVWDLAENLERLGVRNATVTNETPERLADHFGPFFDRVLVDAPCSGEGMFRKSESARKDWSPDLVRSCALRQKDILYQAARLVKTGGYLAYTTCTFSPQENESTVVAFIEENGDEFELVDLKEKPNYAPGRSGWLDNPSRVPVEHTMHLWPHQGAAEGHFIALMRRVGEKNGFSQRSSSNAKKRTIKLQSDVDKLFRQFCQENLKISLDSLSPLLLHGSYLYKISNNLPNLDGIRVIHPGWWLGQFKKNRFEPSHAFAMALSTNDVLQIASFALDEADLQAYLKGETLTRNRKDGWVLCALETANSLCFPLGWGKQTIQTLKNYYPRGLRVF